MQGPPAGRRAGSRPKLIARHDAFPSCLPRAWQAAEALWSLVRTITGPSLRAENHGPFTAFS